MCARDPLLVAGTLFLVFGGDAAAQQQPVPAQHSPDCTCRVDGRSVEIGTTACLRTPHGRRIAECGMVLNNTSWVVTDRPCPET